MGKKYIIEKDDNESIWSIYADANGDATIEGVSLTPYTEPDLERVRLEAEQLGMVRAWGAARKIWEYDTTTLKAIFGEGNMRIDWFMNLTAAEAIEKLKAYEQEQEDQIQVGDEVVGTYTGEEETEPFVIIRKIPEINPTYYFGIYSKSGEFCQGGLKLKKTGRHFPEIAEVLQEMKEA